MGFISHNIMPLVTDSLGGRHTHIYAHIHTYIHTHTQTHTHIHTSIHINILHRSNFKKPGIH